MMKMQDVRDWMIALAVFVCLMMVSYFIGQCAGRADAENELVAKTDTVIQTDTILDPNPKLVHDTLYHLKYVPIRGTNDTIGTIDTVIIVRDSVAVIPISLKTYTDSSTYKAVISGYDPRLESIEVYQTNTVITNTVQPSRWSFGLQGGLYATPKGLQPGIGVGVQYSIPIRFKHN